ncbi:ketoacyl-ACP synthase III family protein [Streptomonospora sediminis]
MKTNGTYIAGIATADPELIDTSAAVANGWYDADEQERSRLQSIAVAGGVPAPDLAIEAARSALDRSGHAPTDISGVFHSSVHAQGPDGWSAQHYINLHTVNQPVTSAEIRNGCVGFFSSLQLSACYLAAADDRTAALLTCADNFGTPAVDRWRASDLFVLADGGGSIVLSKRSGFARVLAVHAVSDPELEERHRGREPLFPPGITTGAKLNFRERTQYVARKWREGGPAPAGDFGSVVIDAAETALKEAGTALDDIARVVHDGFTYPAVRDVFLDPLAIEEERGIWEFTRHYGHAGPLDQIRGIQYLWREGGVGVGDRVLMLGGAPGMEAAAAVLEITSAP